ncbi:MAG TPA: T9SS type A sorting domain-containing protein, partial [Chitinophagales bacterium]|nr:T9SS type A sorting domain-containing protein [Chitinophagales bacterium]
FTGWNQGNVNKLKWVTASEFNTAYYEIQRSVVSGAWDVIGQKLAAGNSNAQLTYDFTDNNPVIGDNYYRLKMVDKDGTFKYSNVIDIPISEAVVNNFTRIYPNPTGGNLNVEIQSIALYDTKLTVHDVLGKKVFEKPITLSKGLNTMQFDFSQLAQGTYIIQFADADGKLHTTKFVKD